MSHTVEQIVVAAQELPPEEVRRVAPRVATEMGRNSGEMGINKKLL